MEKYPEKTCEIDALVRNKKMVKAVLDGNKTQQRRNGIYGYPGEKFELEGVLFTITNLENITLSKMTDLEAKAEGYTDLESYKNFIINMHPGMSWNDDAKVWVHSFAKVQE